MKKKFLLVISMVALLVCVFAITVSATMTGSTSNVFGEKISIDGMNTSGMATDDGSRVVLQHTVDDVTYYNTYPANYIVTNKSTNRIDYTNINAALASKGETFIYDDTSVIRLEMPTSATNTNSEIKNMSNLKELIFLPGSSQTSFKTQEFLNASFERIVIPSSINTTSNGNVFNNCINLKEVVFQEGFSCTSLGNGWFSGCTALETFTFPKSVTSVGSNFFKGCTALKSIYMENVTSLGQYWLVNCTDGVKLYVSSSITSFGQFSYNNASPKATVFYTGDFDGASAIKEAGAKVIKNASLVEYDITKPDGYYMPDSPEAWTIVYNYSKCNAFYNREHENDINPCVINCDRCSTYGVEKENPIHSIVSEVKYTSYDKVGTITTTCQNEGCKHKAVTEAPALFEAIGYSVPEDIDKGGIVIGYIVNHSAVAEYEKNTGKTVNYGVYAVAQKNLGENDIFDENGNVADGVVDAKVEKNAYVSFEFKLVGFDEDTKDEKLALGAYVAVTKDKVTEYSYIQLGTPAEGAKYAFTSYTEYLASLS